MRVSLIYLPYHIDNNVFHKDRICPPLGLISLKNYIVNNRDDVQVDLVYYEHDVPKITDRVLSADVVGFNVTSYNYKDVLNLAKKAKNNGSLVVVGGPHSTALSEKILKNQQFIDIAVVGDGEQALLDIINKRNLNDINNIVYRNNGEIIKNKRIELDLNSLPDMDYSLVDDLNLYDQAPINSQKGCLWRERTGGCIFCSRQDISLRNKDVNKFWREMINLKRYFNGMAFDFSDCVTADKDFFKKLVRSKPKEPLNKLRLYSRAPDISQENIDFMKEIGVIEVLVGLDSGDDNILKVNGKGSTAKINKRSIELLRKNNIKTIVTIITGLLGENKSSLKNSLNHIKEIEPVDSLNILMMHPFPNSKAFDLLMEKNYLRKKYENSDILDMVELSHEWIKNYCLVSREEIIDYMEKMRESTISPITVEWRV